MSLSQNEFEAILVDGTKRIEGEILWSEDEDHSLGIEFRKHSPKMWVERKLIWHKTAGFGN